MDRGDDFRIICQEQYKFYCHYDKIFSIICGSSHVLHTYIFSLSAAVEADVIITGAEVPCQHSSPPNLEIISANIYLLSARIDLDFI